MNNIEKNIFNNYEMVETVLLNELATEAKNKGKKARGLKGEGYYVKYDGVQYDITAEQCRIYRLIRNNYNHFVEQLNSVKSDMLGFWKMAWKDELPNVIADLEKAVEICQKYLDAFKSYVTEGDEEVADEKNGEETEIETEIETTSTEVYEDEIIAGRGVGIPFVKVNKPNGSTYD